MGWCLVDMYHADALGNLLMHRTTRLSFAHRTRMFSHSIQLILFFCLLCRGDSALPQADVPDTRRKYEQ